MFWLIFTGVINNLIDLCIAFVLIGNSYNSQKSKTYHPL